MTKPKTGWKGGLRFQKRIRLWRVFTVNLSRQSASLSMGVQGLHVNIGRRGFFITLGVPGSGWSYRAGFPWRRAKRSPRVGEHYEDESFDFAQEEMNHGHPR